MNAIHSTLLPQSAGTRLCALLADSTRTTGCHHTERYRLTGSARYMILCTCPLRSLRERTPLQQILSPNRAQARWRSTPHSSSSTSVLSDEGDITRTCAYVQRMMQNRLSGVSKRWASPHCRKPFGNDGANTSISGFQRFSLLKCLDAMPVDTHYTIVRGKRNRRLSMRARLPYPRE